MARHDDGENGENIGGKKKASMRSPHTLSELISSRHSSSSNNVPSSSSPRSGSAVPLLKSLEEDILEALNALPQEDTTPVSGNTVVVGEQTRMSIDEPRQLPSEAYPDLICAPREVEPQSFGIKEAGIEESDVNRRRTRTNFHATSANEEEELMYTLDDEDDHDEDDDVSSGDTLLRGYDRDDDAHYQTGVEARGENPSPIDDAGADMYDDDLYGRELLAACAEGAESLAIAEVDVRLASISRQLKLIMARVESGEQAINRLRAMTLITLIIVCIFLAALVLMSSVLISGILVSSTADDNDGRGALGLMLGRSSVTARKEDFAIGALQKIVQKVLAIKWIAP